MRRLWFLAVPLVAVVAAGCGTRLTQPQLDTKVKAVCAHFTQRAQNELQAVQVDPTSPKATPADIARFAGIVEQTGLLFGEQLDALRALSPPKSGEAKYSKVLRLYGQLESAIEQVARAARRDDRAAIAAGGRELDALGAQVDALGFQC